MTEEKMLSRNSAAVGEFKSWQDAARESLNQIATTLVEEQKRMIAAILAEENVDFRVKLQLLEMHTGQELFLDEATGLSHEQFGKWKRGEDLPSLAQQLLILRLCETTIFEWLEDRYPLEQLIGVIGFTSIEGRTLTPSILKAEIPVREVIQDDSFAILFAQNISELGLSVRSINCLKNEGIEYVGQLIDYTEFQLRRIVGFGRWSLNEVKEILSIHGVRLGMGREHFPALAQFLQQHPPLKSEEQR